MRSLPADFVRLRALLADNPAQVARARSAARLAAERMRYLRLGVAHYWRGVPNPPENFLRGQAIMGRFRDVAEEMKAEEDRLLALRTANANQQARWAAVALGVSALLVILLLLLAIRESRTPRSPRRSRRATRWPRPTAG